MPKAKKRNSSMKVKAPGARQSVESMKYEIASEFGVNLGPNATSRDNGLVGGEMTRRLIEKGKKSRSTASRSRKNLKKKTSSK